MLHSFDSYISQQNYLGKSKYVIDVFYDLDSRLQSLSDAGNMKLAISSMEEIIEENLLKYSQLPEKTKVLEKWKYVKSSLYSRRSLK